jgi:hypothetical protein
MRQEDGGKTRRVARLAPSLTILMALTSLAYVYFTLDLYFSSNVTDLQIVSSVYSTVFIIETVTMVRHYKRKSARGLYGIDKIHAALDAVKNGQSVRNSSAVHGIPRKTLQRHLAGRVNIPGHLGRFQTALSAEVEEVVVNHVKAMQGMFFGLCPNDVRMLAFDLSQRLNMTDTDGRLNRHVFNPRKLMAGVDWFAGFMRRHNDISLRQPEATSLCRAVGFNRPAVDKFFKLLKAVTERESLTPDRIWNVDESGVTTVHTPKKIIANRGQKQVGKITSGERGQTSTVVCAMSAAGTYCPPMIIFARKRMSDLLMKDAPPLAIGAISDNGWINQDLFVRWLQHFIDHVHPTVDRKVLLLLDGHNSHKSLAVIELARDNGVELLCLPPHTTHRLQPLDVTFFGPLKTAYNTECDKFMVNHVAQRITTYDVAGLFAAAYIKTANMSKCVKGFECTGICPYNPDVFCDDDFAPSSITDEPEPVTAFSLSGASVPYGQSGEHSYAKSSTCFRDTLSEPASSSTGVRDTPSDPASSSTGVRNTLSEPASSSTGVRHTPSDPASTSTGVRDTLSEPASSSTGVRDTPSDPASSSTGVRDTPSDQASSSTGVRDTPSDPASSSDGTRDTLSEFDVPTCSGTHSQTKLRISNMTALIHKMSPVPKCKEVRGRKRKAQAAELLTSSPYKNKLLLDNSLKQLKNSNTLKTVAKKLTCRQDKKRGRKGNGLKAKSESNRGKGKMSALVKTKLAASKSTINCLFCDEVYTEPPFEDWVQCPKCKRWYHEECGDEDLAHCGVC